MNKSFLIKLDKERQNQFLVNVDGNEYLRVIQALPEPTFAQTERFARYVADAHSWYKHLPIFPKVPFHFFLDPSAGMDRMLTPTGELALLEITDDSEQFHYNWQTTRDYRNRFGFWNYHAAYGSSLLRLSPEGVAGFAGGLRFLTEVGDWVEVPRDLVEVGTAFVSAFMHRNRNYGLWERNQTRFGLAKIPDDDATVTYPINSVVGKLWHVLREYRTTASDPSEIPNSVSPQAMQYVARTIAEGETNPGFWLILNSLDWPDETWVQQLREWGLREAGVSKLAKYLPMKLTQSCLKKGNEFDEANQPKLPKAMKIELLSAMIEERAQELLAMTDAMQRFAAAVYLF